MKIRPRSLLLPAGLLLTVLFFVWLRGAVREARDAARRSQCIGNLCGITLAMHNYHDLHGEFPPAHMLGPDGQPWHSWRVLLLPYLGESEVYAKYSFEEPWDGPNNRQLLDRMPRIYACPADLQGAAEFRTNYYVIVGNDTPFPGDTSISIDEVETSRSETLMVVESATLRALWMQPQDLVLETTSFTLNDRSKPSISSPHLDHRVSARAVDGSSSTLPPFPHDSIEPADLRARCLIRPAAPAAVP